MQGITRLQLTYPRLSCPYYLTSSFSFISIYIIGMNRAMSKPLMLRALSGEITPHIPLWLMRQAGRYLPEYQAIRKDFEHFLNFCYTPDAAAEVTLQPIRRFGMDAAILFSDILVIPDALGQKVNFVKGEGPKLEPIEGIQSLRSLDSQRVVEYLAPVFQTIRNVKSQLENDKILIGFSGSPWTLACYMIEGQGSRDFAKARAFMVQQPEAFAYLMQMLVRSISDYCCAQIEAGVDAIQLFDSWAGVAPARQFDVLITRPTAQIVTIIKAKYPKIPIIGFAKGAGALFGEYAAQTGVNALGIDQHLPLEFAKNNRNGKTLQGNLDNVIFASSKREAIAATTQILQQMQDTPFIFNLGHGVLPHTPIEHVASVIETVRGFKR